MIGKLNLVATGVVLALAVSTANAVVVYEENFNAFANGALAGQNGWVNNINDGLDISSGVAIGDGTDGGSRVGNIMSFNGSAASVTVEMTMRARVGTGFQTLAGITDAAGNQFIQFGTDSSVGYRLRRQDGSNLFNANISGNDTLSTSSHQFFDHRLTFDFMTGMGLWEVSKQAANGGDGLYSTVTSFTLASIGALITDQANWSGIALRSNATADQFDNIRISAVFIPEPATAMVLTLAAGSLTLIRGRRRLR